MKLQSVRAALALALWPATPSLAQALPGVPPERNPKEAAKDLGRTTESGVGKVGQRQTKESAPLGLETVNRLATRIETRVENRIRNRIDRDYDPNWSVRSAFASAEARAREAKTAPLRRKASGR